MRRWIAATSMILAGFSAATAAEPTVGWRNDASGSYPDATPPIHWSPTENVVWKVKLPGSSYGSPVVVGDRLYVVSDPAELLCLKADDGEVLWQRTVSAAEVLGKGAAEKLLAAWNELNQKRDELRRELDQLQKSKPDAKEKHETLRERVTALDRQVEAMRRETPIQGDRGSGNTAATPLCDGRHVYALFGTGIAAAFDLEGEKLWSRFVEGSPLGFGHSSSPLLIGGKLIVHYHDLIALDAASGETLWRVEVDARHATAAASPSGDEGLLVTASGGVIRVSDGKLLLTDGRAEVSEGSPVVHGGVLFSQSGRTVALRLPDADDEAEKLELLWQADTAGGRRTPSPVIHDGLLYGLTTNGILEVIDVETGDVAYRKRLEIGDIYSSATAAGDYVFLTSTAGETGVIRAGRTYKETARNKLESFGANPVFVGSRMYFRGHQHLYCIGESFEGFPPIGVHRQAERSRKVITSDGVAGVLRPQWTRAMTDLGGWPAMFRFKGDIYFVFYHGDGHRYKRLEATGRLKTYRSRDEGRTWTEVASVPPSDSDEFQGTPEFLPVGDKLYCYDWNHERQTQVRISTDGVTWSEPQDCYKPPFYFWGVMYDDASKTFWAPPHAIPHKGASDERQIRLIRSQDGIEWEDVSQVASFNNCSESTMRFEEDGTLVMIIRRKYGRQCNVAVARPPYTDWTLTERPVIAEGEHFFDIGGQTFLASRALYRGDNADVLANEKVFDGRKAYSTIYRFTSDRQLEEWAVMDSMGDCSYPFLVETPTSILCAYYSQHENGVCKAYLCAFDKEKFLERK